MEVKIGRKLSSKEHVHHINGNCKDNRIDNLMLVSPEEHGRIHKYYLKRERELNFFLSSLRLLMIKLYENIYFLFLKVRHKYETVALK